MKPSEQLRVCKALIATPETWTQDAWAKDSMGKECPSGSDDAVCWCSHGALNRVGADELARGYLRDAALGSIMVFNDTHTHSEVMEMWGSAIELAEKDELK